MKQTVEMDKVQHNMRPGCITLKGLLGEDKRNLVDILIEDEGEVIRLGTSHKAIAERMQELRDSGVEGLGESITIEDRYDVRVDSVRGLLPCPYEDGTVQKTFIQVHNRMLKRSITYTDLHIHMIREHGFYEGKGSSFRLSPQDLVEILDVPPSCM